MDTITLWVYFLATWRISTMLVCEDGPGDILANLRRELCRIKLLHSLLDCVWCVSIWVAAGWAALDFLLPFLAPRLAVLFAFSAAAVIIERVMEVTEAYIAKCKSKI